MPLERLYLEGSKYYTHTKTILNAPPAHSAPFHEIWSQGHNLIQNAHARKFPFFLYKRCGLKSFPIFFPKCTRAFHLESDTSTIHYIVPDNGLPPMVTWRGLASFHKKLFRLRSRDPRFCFVYASALRFSPPPAPSFAWPLSASPSLLQHPGWRCACAAAPVRACGWSGLLSPPARTAGSFTRRILRPGRR